LQEVAVARGLLVAGTTSDAGKSLVTAGICRWLAREGVSAAPFKAQNMSNNSMVCRDGSEIGRAQWVQALAAGAEPEAAMNPVLLKPDSDRRSHVVVMGRPWGHLESGEWAAGRRALAETAFAAYDDLAARFDVIIAEGAGSPAEINLRDGDYVNLGLARAKDLPVVVVGDIDRGGVLAAMSGTLAILEPGDQVHLKAWIINKFRGDLDLLRPGLQMLENRTERPVLGVIPFLPDVWLDSEDALATAGWPGRGVGHEGIERLSVAVVRLPRVSNATDVDALASEPGVDVVVTADPRVVQAADLCVLPGTRATISDLQWLRETGLAEAVVRRAGAGRPVLGVCGGFQMLAEQIDDPQAVESAPGTTVSGLGVLPTRVCFEVEKHLGTATGSWRGTEVSGYLIHHGVSRLLRDGDVEPFLDGWSSGGCYGTTWHGALESDAFRRAFLREVADRSGSSWTPSPQAAGFAEVRRKMLDALGDAIADHLDTTALRALIEGGTVQIPTAARSDPVPASRPSGKRSRPATERMSTTDLRHHGDAEVGPGMLDFAVNVLVPEPPTWLQAELRDRLSHLAGYPALTRASAAAARHHGLAPGRVLLTNGAAEAFSLIARARPWRHAVVVHPQFTEPEAALEAAGHDVTRVVLDVERGFALDTAEVPHDADLVVVGNPTNPTSVLHPRTALEALRRPGRVLVVDEAFLDVTTDPEGVSLAAVAGSDEVVVVRSLTKSFGLAGLRAGYLLASPQLVVDCAAVQPPWSVNALAATAIEACLGERGARHLAGLRAVLAGRREHLVRTLTSHGFLVTEPAAGPFVLGRHPGAAGIRTALRHLDVAVRRGDTFPGLDDSFLRFAVRDERMVDALGAALSAVQARPGPLQEDGGESGGWR